MSFNVHKIFTLYSLYQSQLHKRYPPVIGSNILAIHYYAVIQMC